MGNMEDTCGALVGADIILGLATHDKAKFVKGMRQIMDKFKQLHLAFLSEAQRKNVRKIEGDYLSQRRISLSQMMNEGIWKYGIRLLRFC